MSGTADQPAASTILRVCVPACWAAAICGGVWSVASKTTEPPVYDAIGYIWKAKAIWERVAGYELFNPFNVVPTIRPPGTVLLSYPFGFNDSVNGYLFRSVAVPYVLWTAAVWLAASPWLRRSTTAAALFIAAMGTLPMFFQYAVGPGPFVAYWGLVDGFLGSLAGLAAAGLVRDWNRRSSPSFFMALAAACLGVWVKPAGVPLLLLWLGVWLVSLVGRALRQTTWLAGLEAEVRQNRERLVVTGVMVGLTLGCAFGTQYISQEAILFGRNSFAVAAALFRDNWTVRQAAWFAAGTIGWVPLAVVLILGAARFFTHRDGAGARHPPWFAIGAWTAFVVGLWLAVPPMQIRYFFPFVLFWLTLLLPRLAETFESVQPARVTVSTLLTAHLVLMGIVILAPSSLRRLQTVAGVRTAPSAFVEDTALARSLSVAAAAMTPERPRVAYIFQGHYGLGLFESEIIYRAAVKPGRRLSDPVALTPRGPMDWERGPVVKLSDLSESDYLVLNRRIEPSWLAHAEASTFAGEQDVLQAYFSSLGPADGVRPWGSTRLVAVLEVVDREAFTTKLETFVRSRTWRKFFLDANASVFAPASHELETPHTKPDHPNQQQSVSKSSDVGRAVYTLVVAKWKLDDSQIELCCSKQQIVVAERIELTEVGAVLDEPFVVGSRKRLRPAQRILDRLPQHVGEAERKTFVSDEVDEAHRFVVHRINEP